MSGPDYTATIEVPVPPEQALRVVHDEMHKWWSLRVDYMPDGVTVHFASSHVTFDFLDTGTPLTADWKCRRANMVIEGVSDVAEWEGTHLKWRAEPAPSGSRLTLTHQGLNDTMECIDVCTGGWQKYFENSLKNHLSGIPASPETR